MMAEIGSCSTFAALGSLFVILKPPSCIHRKQFPVIIQPQKVGGRGWKKETLWHVCIASSPLPLSHPVEGLYHRVDRVQVFLSIRPPPHPQLECCPPSEILLIFFGCLSLTLFAIVKYLFSFQPAGRSLYRDIFTSLQHLTRQQPDYAAFQQLKQQFRETRRHGPNQTIPKCRLFLKIDQ